MSNYDTLKNYRKISGIYKLTCTNNGKIYIGKSVNIGRRFNEYQNIKNARCYFENAILKYGWDAFTVEILDIFENFDKIKDNNALLDKESYYIGLFDSDNKDKGYNICKYSIDTTGMPLSEDHKEKIRRSCLGNTHSEDTKNKISKSNLGIPKSPEHKEKIRLAMSGKIQTSDHIQKVKQSKLGYKHSKDTIERIRKSTTGRIVSEETKEKMRLAKRKPHNIRDEN